MATILATAGPTDAAGTAGTIALVLILLAMTVGLVLIVRTLMVKLHNRVASQTHRMTKRGNRTADSAGDGQETEEDHPVELPPAKSGRELKARYLRGEISKAEFDEQLRALQLSEYLEDRE